MSAKKNPPYDVSAVAIKREFGRLFRAQRRAIGISQIRLAHLIEVNRGTIITWEKGKNLPDIAIYPVVYGMTGIYISELIDKAVHNLFDD